MQKTVKERVKPQHSPKFYQLIPAVIFAKRRNRKRYEQKNERQNAGRAKKKLNRIGAEFTEQSIPT